MNRGELPADAAEIHAQYSARPKTGELRSIPDVHRVAKTGSPRTCTLVQGGLP